MDSVETLTLLLDVFLQVFDAIMNAVLNLKKFFVCSYITVIGFYIGIISRKHV